MVKVRGVEVKCERKFSPLKIGEQVRSRMKPKGYIVWSKRELDLNDEWQRRWYLKQVLLHGRSEDIRILDWDEIRGLYTELDLPRTVRRVWERYFHAQG